MVTNPLNIFLLNIHLDKFVIGLRFLLISYMLQKFSKDQKSIVIPSIKYFNFKILYSKIMHKKQIHGSNSK